MSNTKLIGVSILLIHILLTQVVCKCYTANMLIYSETAFICDHYESESILSSFDFQMKMSWVEPPFWNLVIGMELKQECPEWIIFHILFWKCFRYNFPKICEIAIIYGFQDISSDVN